MLLEGFLVGFLTAVVSFLMAYSYMPIEMKRTFNSYFANPIVDIIFTVGVMGLAGATASGLVTALGIGFGFSLSLRTAKWLYGIGG